MPPTEERPLASEDTEGRPGLAGHLAIMRVDHWFKNVFVIPGIAVAILSWIFSPALQSTVWVVGMGSDSQSGRYFSFFAAAFALSAACLAC